MKKAGLYVRVSTSDQHVQSQLYDLRELAAKRGFEVVKEYQDCGVSGRRARRPGLDALMADARQHKFAVVAELESDLIRERVLAGMRRAKLDGVRIGRAPMNLDPAAIVRDRLSGMTLTAVAKKWGISRSLVYKLVKRAGAGDEGFVLPLPTAVDSAQLMQSSSADAGW